LYYKVLVPYHHVSSSRNGPNTDLSGILAVFTVRSAPSRQILSVIALLTSYCMILHLCSGSCIDYMKERIHLK